jgi:hypothetical protein
MSKLAKALTAAAGNAGESLYAEDVFSTYLYTGNDTDTNIVNGINLADEGGLVWIKSRQAAEGHRLIDSEWSLSANKYIDSSSTTAPFTGPVVNTFNTDGFQLDSNWYGNSSDPQYGGDFTSWTFRKAEKFFDVVTYTGDETSGRQIAHNLGATPAVMIVKKTSGSYNWQIYHSSIGATKFLEFTDYFAQTSSAVWNDTAPTDSVFTVGNEYGVNQSGDTYVAYLFASDAGGFGDDGTENIIKCGSFTTDGSGLFSVTLGFEPQWILVKRTSGTGNWFLVDAMRGLTAAGIDDALLLPNSSSAEIDSNWFDVTATGFNSTSSNPDYNSDYIYIAIRRPMKTPESGTEVFAMDTLGSTGDGNQPGYRSPFPVDMGLKTSLTGNQRQISTRLLQGTELLTESTAAEAASASKQFDYMNGTDTSTATSSVNMMWMFKRATGFFDVVAYTGDGGTTQTLDHNLGVTPEFMIAKRRNDTQNWVVYHSLVGAGKYYNLNTTSGASTLSTVWGGVEPTSTQFTVGNSTTVNFNGDTYISYHFATLAGVSKVGSYTGTGSDLNVDCGFSAGARFILIKRTDSTGDWYVYDSLRGIVAGNDPYFFLNNTAAQVTNTDYIDPLNAGFTVTSSAPAGLNASGGTYIFLAIA